MEVMELLVPMATETGRQSITGSRNESKACADTSPFSSLLKGIMQRDTDAVSEKCKEAGPEQQGAALIFAPCFLTGILLQDVQNTALEESQSIPEANVAVAGISPQVTMGDIPVADGYEVIQELLENVDWSKDREGKTSVGEEELTVPDGEETNVSQKTEKEYYFTADETKDLKIAAKENPAASKAVASSDKGGTQKLFSVPEGEREVPVNEMGINVKAKIRPQTSGLEASDEEEKTNPVETRIKVKEIYELNTGSKPVEAKDEAGQTVKVQTEIMDIKSPEMVDRVVEKVKILVNTKRSEVSVQLKPESLGKLSFKLEVVEGVLNGKITVQNSHAREILQANINQLKENLEQNGIPVSKLTVNIGGNGEYRHHQFNQGEQHNPQSYAGRWKDSGYTEVEPEEILRWTGGGTVEYLA